MNFVLYASVRIAALKMTGENRLARLYRRVFSFGPQLAFTNATAIRRSPA
jgi:hypothetical protein